MQRTSTHYFEGVQWVSNKRAVWPLVARVLTQLGPPVLCFVLARGMLHAAAIATGNDPFDANTWSRWDSEQYVSIAHRGYELSTCEGIEGYEPDDWCGNDAWLPGYAFLIRLVVQFGHWSFAEAGVMISAACALASLFVIWVLFLGAKLSVNNVLVLLLAAFFPGHVYDHAVFPIAQFVLFSMLSLWLYSKRRFAYAGLCATLAAFSYSSGLFLCGALCLFALISARGRVSVRQFKELAWPCGGVLLGFSAALALQWSQTGVWNAFFLVQQKYGYSPRTPIELWGSNLEHLLQNWPRNGGPNEQSLFVAALCLLMFGYTFKHRVASRFDLLLAAFAVVYWLLPITLGGQLSLHRAEATLLPAVPLARTIPWPILSFLAYLAIQLSWLMGRKFFRGTIT